MDGSSGVEALCSFRCSGQGGAWQVDHMTRQRLRDWANTAVVVDARSRTICGRLLVRSRRRSGLPCSSSPTPRDSSASARHADPPTDGRALRQRRHHTEPPRSARVPLDTTPHAPWPLARTWTRVQTGRTPPAQPADHTVAATALPSRSAGPSQRCARPTCPCPPR